MPIYDPKVIEGHFDEYGEDEWDRLEKNPLGQVQFHIHMHYLKKYIQSGSRVLEIGPGPGRFTIELAKMGTKIGIVDISNVQLQLNETKVKEAGCEKEVLWRKKRDILNLEGIPDSSFDMVVCFGGPFSYVLEFINDAIREVLRVTKSKGIVLASVMSCIGTYQHYLHNVFEEVIAGNVSLEEFDNLTRTGDVVGKLASKGTHQCHMYRWNEFREILYNHPIEILDASATNFLSTGSTSEEILMEMMKDPKTKEMFLKWELDFCKEPGAIDGGTHMLVVFQKM